MIQKIKNKEAKICVVGLGYMGLPMAALLAKAGFRVLGFDINKQRVSEVNDGRCGMTEEGLPELMKEAYETSRLSATTQISDAQDCDIFIVSVPTPKKDNRADLSFVSKAIDSISQVISEDNLVVLESTVPPGTSKEIIVEKLMKDDLNIFVAHCPERAIPGNTLYEMVNNDRIIGGLDEKSSLIAKELYQNFCKGNIYLTDTNTAETVKLMENTFRDVNIALANEFAKISEEININVWEAIDLANKHPRVNIHQPGPGVGGHCISIDPLFLAEKAKSAKLIPLAREINDSMPQKVVELLENELKKRDMKQPVVAILGVAYKKNVDDARETPAENIIKILLQKNWEVRVHDPHVKSFSHELLPLDKTLEGANCAILVTDHDFYRDIDLTNIFVIDTRNFLETDNKVILGDYRNK